VGTFGLVVIVDWWMGDYGGVEDGVMLVRIQGSGLRSCKLAYSVL